MRRIDTEAVDQRIGQRHWRAAHRHFIRSRFSASERPNRLTACPHCGLVSFIWPSSAPTTSTGDMPLISAGDMLPAPAMLALDIKNLFGERSEEHTSELQSLMRISYAVFCLKKKNIPSTINTNKKQKSIT